MRAKSSMNPFRHPANTHIKQATDAPKQDMKEMDVANLNNGIILARWTKEDATNAFHS